MYPPYAVIVARGTAFGGEFCGRGGKTISRHSVDKQEKPVGSRKTAHAQTAQHIGNGYLEQRSYGFCDKCGGYQYDRTFYKALFFHIGTP